MTAFLQYLVSGLSVGCIYAFVALGLVTVANVTGVFNFATGDYVMVGAMTTAVTSAAGWPMALAVLMAVVAVTALAVVQERVTVAPARGKVGPLGLVIGSLGVGVVIRGVALLIWGEDPRNALPFQSGSFHFLGISLQNQVKWVFLATIVALVMVALLFVRTDIGRAMRASAINPMAARLTGIRIGTTSLVAFALTGALSGLIGAVSASVSVVRWDAGVTIGLVGFIAAAIAGFDSPVKAVVAGLALGVTASLSAGEISSEYSQAIVYGTIVVYLLARDFIGGEGVISRAIKTRRASAAGSQEAPELRERIRQRVHALQEQVLARPLPTARLRAIGRGRLTPMMALPVVLLVLAALYPSTTSDSQTLDTANFILLSAIAATGLGLVMGLAGQFSLGHGVFILLSGYMAAILTANHGWTPIEALGAATAAAVAVGAIIGWITLRLEGLNLALATLAILVAALVVVTQARGLTGGTQGVNGVSPLTIFGTTITSQKSYYLIFLGVLAVMLLIARNVWNSRMGRTLRAIGIDQEAAESIGLDSFHLKLKVVVLSAGMAGVTGVLWAYYLQFASPDTWDVNLTINLVTYVIVGGVISPYGAAVGAVAVGALQYWVQQHVGSSTGSSSTWQIIISGALLIFFVLFFRDGLASIPRMIVDQISRFRGRTATAEGQAPPAESEDAEAIAAERELAHERTQMGEPLRAETPLVVIEGLTKRFGSLVAVNDVSFSLRPGYITAMIGPNGAGKSTVINLLSGTLVPSDGNVGIMGHPVAGLDPQEIAQLGLARTFQTPRLFEGMTLLETVMLARDRYGSRSWLFGCALKTPRARRDEVKAREQAMAWLAYVGLADEADMIAASLTTGKQRLAELARALATEPTVLLLDEPAAGLDGAETRLLAQMIRNLADAGIAVLLVEHDMEMVMSTADHVIVLEEGRKIAEGTAEEVSRDQAVVDAYLGVVHA